MALYTTDTGGFDGDIKKVEAYLYKLNKNLEYMFANLDPEDNWTEDAKLIFVETQDKIATLEVSVDGIIASVTDTVTNYNSTLQVLAGLMSLTASTPEGSSSMVLTGDYISLSTGKFIVNSTNLTIDAAGNATFSGTVSGATINGRTMISCGSDFFIDAGASNPGEYDFILGNFEISKEHQGQHERYCLHLNGESLNKFAIWETGVMWADDISLLTLDDYLEPEGHDGYTVSDLIWALWQAVDHGSSNPAHYLPY